MIPRLLGITGPVGCGKDTLADYLVKQHGFVRYGFADSIKGLLNKCFGWTNEQWNDRKWKESAQLLSRDTVDEFVSKYGRTPPQRPREAWSPRQLAQWLGTEAGRMTHGEDCWVNVFERWYRAVANMRIQDQCAAAQKTEAARGIKMPPDFKVVIPDVRFENEAARIRQLGGIILHLTRPGHGKINDHVSENGIIPQPTDYRLDNFGSIQDMFNLFERIFS